MERTSDICLRLGALANDSIGRSLAINAAHAALSPTSHFTAELILI
jgi:hypothetical protein